jgi:hypothetical protein
MTEYFDPFEYPHDSPARYLLPVGYLFGANWIANQFLKTSVAIVDGDATPSVDNPSNENQIAVEVGSHYEDEIVPEVSKIVKHHK